MDMSKKVMAQCKKYEKDMTKFPRDMISIPSESCKERGVILRIKKEMQKNIFDIIGLEKEDAEKRFGFLLRAFEYGAPPHAGVAYGIDRIVAILTGLESIRDTIAFPKTQKGNCLITDAPSDVDKKQLQELGLMTLNKGGKDA